MMNTVPSQSAKSREQQWLGYGLLGIFCIELIRTAWISDDAGFTLRSVLNFLNGYGPTFNIDERVQAFTHPLWFLMLSALTLMTKNVITSAYVLPILTSLCFFYALLTKWSQSIFGALIVGVALVLSKAFIDFSTSALENPLVNLLLLIASLIFLQLARYQSLKSLALFVGACAGVYLTRPDAILLLLPTSIYSIYFMRSMGFKLLLPIFFGILPALIWTLFSLYYYGSPVPNTAFAKLGTSINQGELAAQGLMYFLNSIGQDPITLLVILLGTLIGFRQSLPSKLISLGILLYLVYIVYIGGDFMSGRFFVAPLVMACMNIATYPFSKNQAYIVIGLVGVIGVLGIKFTLLSDSTFNVPWTKIPQSGIADERGVYYPQTSLLKTTRHSFASQFWEKNLSIDSNPVVRCNYALETFLASGPNTHFINDCALADPLLARLPAVEDPGWRVGHYFRELPQGYEESIAAGTNQIKDPAIHQYYESIRLATRGDLNTIDRLSTILKLNFTKQIDPYKLALAKGINFSDRDPQYFFKKIEGLSSPEYWGRWSDAKANSVIKIHSSKNLPKEFDLLLTAKGFGFNVGAPTKIMIGGVEKNIQLKNELETFILHFSLNKEARVIEIVVPMPTSPNEINARDADTRKLGIGLQSMKFSNFSL